MIDFLFSIVIQLVGRKIETPLENGRRMLSVVTIMCCILRMVSGNIKLNLLLDPYSMSLFLSMLRLWPDQDHKRCIDWEYLDKNIPAEFRKESYDSVRRFITDLSSCADPLSRQEWIVAIPVMHFLKGASKPFQEFEFDPKAVQFGDKLITLGAVRGNTYQRDNIM